jgi:hypothetical protein
MVLIKIDGKRARDLVSRGATSLRLTRASTPPAIAIDRLAANGFSQLTSRLDIPGFCLRWPERFAFQVICLKSLGVTELEQIHPNLPSDSRRVHDTPVKCSRRVAQLCPHGRRPSAGGIQLLRSEIRG